MERSWLSSNLSSALTLRDSDSTTEDMRASMIPPPITQSVYRPPPRLAGRSSSTMQPQQPWYTRKQRVYEADLQLLLDAQAERLVAGSEGEAPTSSAGSVTSDHPSMDGSYLTVQSGTFVRRREGHITLRAARRGLYTTMRRLALLKQEEGAEVAQLAEGMNGEHAQLRSWSSRQERLRQKTTDISQGTVATSAQKLRDQASAMQPEIDDLEMKLVDLRNRQRHLMREAEDVENRVQAKLSLHARNLEVLQRDITTYVRDMRPLNDDEVDVVEDAFWQLPTKRRTLDMAMQMLTKEKATIDRRSEQVELEKDALEEGAVVWRDVVKEIEGFERDLRNAMSPSNTKGIQVVDLLHWTRQIGKQLESKLRLAESRGWKLLVAAIGAEFEAFQKGRDLLQQIAAPEPGLMPPSDDPAEGLSNSVIRAPLDSEQSGDEIEKLDHASQGPKTHDHHDEDDDDDGPDPELLISHQDTDTD